MTCFGDVGVPRVDLWMHTRPNHVRIHCLGIFDDFPALLVRKIILFIMDYDSNYLEYYFRIGNGFLE